MSTNPIGSQWKLKPNQRLARLRWRPVLKRPTLDDPGIGATVVVIARECSRKNRGMDTMPDSLAVLDLDGEPRELRALADAGPVVVAFLRHFG
jgi:hypothetical protein